MRNILLLLLLSFAATATAQNRTKIGKALERHNSLVAYWDFSAKEYPLKARGCTEEQSLLRER